MEIFKILSDSSGIEHNPSFETLKQRSLERGAKLTKYDSIAVFPEVRSRLEDKTEIIWDSPNEEQLSVMEKARLLMRDRPLVRLDRKLGDKRAFHCTLFISAQHPEPALVWSSLLTPVPMSHPDFVTISIPEFPEQHVYVFPNPSPMHPPLVVLLGIDYGGEHKMSFLRQYLYQMKKNDQGLGLHAASMSFMITGEDGRLHQKNAVFLANSGTGKSTLSSHSYGLVEPEHIIFRQDDIVGWSMTGEVFGTEQERFYMIVADLSYDRQPNICAAANSPNAVLENVMILPDGTPDFSDLSLSKNPRVAVPVSELGNTDGVIDIPGLDFVFLITRQFDILPPLLRLSPQRAVYEFLCGRTVETAAAGQDNTGNMRRFVGFSPFIMDTAGRSDQFAREGRLFRELLRENPHVRVFLVNTGSMGGPKDGGPCDITIEDSTSLINAIVHDRVVWMSSIFGEGYEEPRRVPGIDMPRFDVYTYHSQEEARSILMELRKNDSEWMTQFQGKL